MSIIKNKLADKAFGPPVFPLGGRLPTEISVVGANYRRQAAEENLFCRQSDSAGRSRRFVCCHSMHISLFFDGANNNDNNDTKKDHPSNIVKLYHASIQDDEAKGSGYCSYYMPGVGTPFPEVGELDYSEKGLKYATGGEDCINWGLVSIADALHWATAHIGLLAAELKTQIAQEDLAEGLDRATAMLRATGSMFEIDGEVA